MVVNPFPSKDLFSFLPITPPMLGLGLWNLPLRNGVDRVSLFSPCDLCLLEENQNEQRWQLAKSITDRISNR